MPSFSSVIATLYLFSKTLSTLISTQDLLPSYDYVVCGGGLSALVVSSRLAEDSNGLLFAASYSTICWPLALLVNVLVISDGPLWVWNREFFLLNFYWRVSDDGAEDTFIPRFEASARYSRGVSSVAQDSLNGDARDYAIGKVVWVTSQSKHILSGVDSCVRHCFQSKNEKVPENFSL